MRVHLSTDSVVFNGTTAANIANLKEAKSSGSQLVNDDVMVNKNSQSDILSGKSR